MATCDRSLRQAAGIRSEVPSFSSSLLDAIYRSIDETNAAKTSHSEEQQQQDHRTTTTSHQLLFYREFTMKKDEEMANFRRACMIEKWIEKKAAGDQKSASLRRNSMADFDRKARNVRDRGCGRDRDHEVRDFKLFKNSSSSSSESSSCTGAGFSSSESESFNYGSGAGSRSRSSSAYNNKQNRERPKPIKTTWVAAARTEKPDRENHDFIKTKSKLALKFYGELKKAKQPTSPGGRIAGFLNTLFSGGSSPTKSKSNHSSTAQVTGGSMSSSACSSASSFSRSCLSKTPSSRGSVKRSVRFCPVSVIVDEDARPCGHKNLQEEEDEPTLISLAAKVHEIQSDQIRRVSNNEEEEDYEDEDEDDDDDDDALSYSSSDLFELDSLSELPVFETTHFDKGRPVFNL